MILRFYQNQVYVNCVAKIIRSIGISLWSFLDFAICFRNNFSYRPVGRAVTRSSLEREVWGSNLGPIKLGTVLPTARHRCDISSKEAVLPGRNDAEMGPANSLHASAYYSKYNKRFDWFDLNNFIISNAKTDKNDQASKQRKQKKVVLYHV